MVASRRCSKSASGSNPAVSSVDADNEEDEDGDEIDGDDNNDDDEDDDDCWVWPIKKGATSVGITVFIPPIPKWPTKKDRNS